MPKEFPSKKNGKKKSQRTVPYARGFHPPDATQQRKAIGFGPSPSLSSIPVEYTDQGVEETGDQPFFHSIPPATSIDDWLAQYVEEGQSFGQYLKENPWFSNRKQKFLRQKFVPCGKTICEKYPDGKIYIAKLGDFLDVSFDDLLDYTARFLCLPVQQLCSLEIKQVDGDLKFVDNPTEKVRGRSSRIRYSPLETRHNSKTGHVQIRVDSILPKMRLVIPDDALCLIALTDYDLYGDDTDLFVAGMASGNQHVAIFSLLRYDPTLRFSQELWYDIERIKKVSVEEKTRLMLQRSCKLLVHEICHLLGVAHCIYFGCCMNGSGHLEEDFKQPMMLCPVDLHKLQKLVGFNVCDRYRALYEFYKDKGLIEEAEWTERRLKYIATYSNSDRIV